MASFLDGPAGALARAKEKRAAAAAVPPGTCIAVCPELLLWQELMTGLLDFVNGTTDQGGTSPAVQETTL